MLKVLIVTVTLQIEKRLNAVGKDISILIQPSDLITEIKTQLKKNLKGNYKDFVVQWGMQCCCSFDSVNVDLFFCVRRLCTDKNQQWWLFLCVITTLVQWNSVNTAVFFCVTRMLSYNGIQSIQLCSFFWQVCCHTIEFSQYGSILLFFKDVSIQWNLVNTTLFLCVTRMLSHKWLVLLCDKGVI